MNSLKVLSQFQFQNLQREMEGKKPSPHLKKVLKSYQLTAANTLSGPNSFLSRLEAAANSAGGGATNANATAPNVGSLLVKNNYQDPNGLIHGAKLGEKSNQVIKDEPPTRPPTFRGYSMSDGSSSTSSSSSSSPVSHVGGGGSPPLRTSPPVQVKLERSENVADCCGKEPPHPPTPLPLHPKKLAHRHSCTWREEQQRSMQAAIVLASGLGLGQHQQRLSPPVKKIFMQPQPTPILSASDKTTTEKRETLLEGESISCFVVGGEKRLCFPQILTTVLRPFSLPQINQVCDELQIFCSRCSVDQLEVLKVTGVLPMSAHSCGLITKTDAERLVNALLHRNPPKAAVGSAAARSGAAASSPHNSFRVYHKCFGKCTGIVLYNLYERIDSLCIECVECHGLFSPSRFVTHSHRREVKTCHWGFDSAKWRYYLLLGRDEDPTRWERTLADFKAKFDHKRKESLACEESYGAGDDQLVIKRVRYNSSIDTPLASPTKPSLDPACYLPTKKRLSLLQYSDNDQNNVSEGTEDLESIKKMLTSKLGIECADPVIKMLENLTRKVSSLQKICKNQDQQLLRAGRVSDSKESTGELQEKVNTMEGEMHSLKKQLLMRHND